MTFGNLADRPNLQPLFGPLSREENGELIDRLLAIDARLARLADDASRHVGVPYRPLGLGLVARADGTSAGIHGGPSGDAGDIWFDISPLQRQDAAGGVVSWAVESAIIVFCRDSPEPRGGANTHELLSLMAVGHTPGAVVDILDSHVSLVEVDLPRHPRAFFLDTFHAELPLMWQMRWITTR